MDVNANVSASLQYLSNLSSSIAKDA